MEIPVKLWSNKPAVVVLFALLASLTVNLLALLSYPPWMDEAIIADLTYDYFRDPAYFPQTFGYSTADEGRIYGPVFFLLQTAFLQVLGAAPFVFRLSNLLATYLLIGAVVRLFHAHTGNRKITAWLTLLLLLSTSINENAVSGRMDMVATLFAMLSLLCAFRYMKSDKPGSPGMLLGCALLATLAFLTTPRAAFLLPAPLVLLGYSLHDRRANKLATPGLALQLPGAALVFLVPIALWIHHVGGLREYANLFLHPDMPDFLGPTVIRRWRDWIYLAALLGVFLVYRRHILADRLAVACGATFIAFSLFVMEVGPYRAMILPYIFLIGALAAYLVPHKKFRPVVGTLLAGVVVVFSTPYFLGRAADILYVNRQCRNADDFARQVLAGIPGQASFLADYRFYYLLKGRPVAYAPNHIDYPGFFERSGYPDYILLSEDSEESLTDADYPLNTVLPGRYEKVTRYSCAVRDLGLGAVFESRRNFKDATLYRKQPVAGPAPPPP